MIIIDGSQGEGGGQILRTALALAAITGTPVRIDNIRAGRPKPGLQRQHLAAVLAATQVCNGVVEGAELKSGSIIMTPQQPAAGHYDFAIGSAGSATLVLQTVVPILLRAAGPSTVRICGGTHNAMAPPVEFLTRSLLPVLHKMGIAMTIDLERHGFNPSGGGVLVATIQPWTAPVPLTLRSRGPQRSRHASVVTARLPEAVSARAVAALQRALGWNSDQVDASAVTADGPGHVAIATLAYQNITSVFTGFAEQRQAPESMATRLAGAVQDYEERAAPVCPQLADQLLLPLALGAGGTFATTHVTEHTRTNAAIIARFLGPLVTIATDDAHGSITVRGR